MSTEQTHQRLGVAEGVIQELQDQLQRVSAGRQAAHEALQTIHHEMSLLRSQNDSKSRKQLVEPKSLIPDRFGKKNGPSWRTWSYVARDFVGFVHSAPKTGNEECGKNRAADLRVEHSRIRCDERNGTRVATLPDFQDTR